MVVFFYLNSRYFFKECFFFFTRFADFQHTFAVKLEKCQTTSFANTFVHKTSRKWNSLPASVFIEFYKLCSICFKAHPHYSCSCLCNSGGLRVMWTIDRPEKQVRATNEPMVWVVPLVVGTSKDTSTSTSSVDGPLQCQLAACERTFCCLARLKNYLTNSTLNERLSDLGIIHVEKKIAKTLDIEDIINEFALQQKILD